MAGNNITISTDQVEIIAINIESINAELKTTLEDSQKLINQLEKTWTGEAASETIQSFNEFAAKYFENYDKIIHEYAKFLRDTVAAGYVETENANIGLAEAFK